MFSMELVGRGTSDQSDVRNGNLVVLKSMHRGREAPSGDKWIYCETTHCFVTDYCDRDGQFDMSHCHNQVSEKVSSLLPLCDSFIGKWFLLSFAFVGVKDSSRWEICRRESGIPRHNQISIYRSHNNNNNNNNKTIQLFRQQKFTRPV